MKKIYSLILCMVMTLTLFGVMQTSVKADGATLSSLKVQAKDSAGNLTDVSLIPDFSPEVTEYNATVLNDTERLVLTPATTDDTATYETDWEALDVGDNKTFVYVTAADGTKSTYTIYTKRLTEEEEATYEPEEGSGDTGNESDLTVKVNKVEMKISSGFGEADIPEGFVKTSYTYNDTEVTAIKGEKKNIVAMWLKPTGDGDSKAGFYIYDEEAKNFYIMSNIYIKSRMYTLVNVAEPDKFLDDYETSSITMIDSEVKAWVLDETNSLYLVYAMNWEGETGLYCYDDVEKCFQRYIIDSAASNQLEAANKAINTLQDKNNQLVKKYNKSNSMKWKIIAVLLIIIVILFFVLLNLYLKLKTKKLMNDEDEIPVNSRNREDKKEKREEFYEDHDSEDEDMDEDEELFELIDDDDDDEELFKLVEDEDDFIMMEEEKSPIANRIKSLKSFDINEGEIDISDRIMKEMEKHNILDGKEETNSKESSNYSDDDDDDGFTFI